MRYAEVAKVLLRLLDGGSAIVKARQDTDGDAAEALLRAINAGDGSDAAEALPRAINAGGAGDAATDEKTAAAAKLLQAFAEDGGASDSLLRAVRSELEESERGTESGTAEAAASRAGRRPDEPGKEEFLTAAAQYGDPAPETAARREAELETYATKLRRALEGAGGTAPEAQERRRLGAALEALSSGRLLAFSQGPGSEPEETGGDAGAAGDRNGDTRSGSAASGTGTGTRDIHNFPSSGDWSGSDPEAVSEFFRRDSRRYDAGFGGRET